jgi:hypothetical protein
MFVVICFVMLLVCFSAWGEGFFLASQTAIIGALVLFFGRSIKEAILFTISYLAVCIVLIGGYTPVNILWSLQALNVPIICVSKVSVFEKKENYSYIGIRGFSERKPTMLCCKHY